MTSFRYVMLMWYPKVQTAQFKKKLCGKTKHTLQNTFPQMSKSSSSSCMCWFLDVYRKFDGKVILEDSKTNTGVVC